MDYTFIFYLVLLGLSVGFCAGLLGIGGGMLMVPFLTLIMGQQGVAGDLAVKMAIATSMATIVFTSLASVRAHHKRGAVRWDIVRGLTPGIVIGALIASLGVFALLKGKTLALMFGLFVSYSATQMLLSSRPKKDPSQAPEAGKPAKVPRTLPDPAGLVGAGGYIGFLSGLVGAGGGFVSVPFMTRCNVVIHQAVATSAALGFPIAIFNAIGYIVSGWGISGTPAASAGYIFLPALACIAAGSVLTAPLGARVAHALPVPTLKRIFACVLYTLAAYMLYKALI